MAAQLGGAEWLELSHSAAPANGGIQPLEHRLATAATGTPRGALRERLRLLPGGEVPASVDLVVVDRLGYARSVQLRGA